MDLVKFSLVRHQWWKLAVMLRVVRGSSTEEGASPRSLLSSQPSSSSRERYWSRELHLGYRFLAPSS